LFDITLLDALYLKRGFDRLDESLKISIACTADERLKALSQQFPLFVAPWILNQLPESEWDAIMPEEDEAPCPLLSETGACLVYEYRPMTCRLNGIPLIDVSGEELFDEWCTLNFVKANPLKCEDLRFGFTELFAQELLLFQELIRILTGKTINEVDTIIPAAIVCEMEKVVPVVEKMVDQVTHSASTQSEVNKPALLSCNERRIFFAVRL
jgi:Fe-S-cluster containining protein